MILITKRFKVFANKCISQPKTATFATLVAAIQVSNIWGFSMYLFISEKIIICITFSHTTSWIGLFLVNV